MKFFQGQIKYIPEPPIVDVRRTNIHKAMAATENSTSWFIGDDDDRTSDHTKFYFTYRMKEGVSITIEYDCKTDKTKVVCTDGNPYSIITCTKRQYHAALYRLVRDFVNGENGDYKVGIFD